MGFQLKNISATKQKPSGFINMEALLQKEITFFKGSFSNKKKEAFYTELSVLLRADLELKTALELIGDAQKKETHKQIFQSMIEELVSGKNLSDAVKNQQCFTEYEYYSLKIGEKTGTLKNVSQELGNFFRRKNEQQRILINALSYPIVVLITAFLALAFMLHFVVPMFAAIFKQNKVSLPWITEQIIYFSSFFKAYYGFVLLLFLGIFLFVKIFKKNIRYKKISSRLLLKIPFAGDFTRKLKLAQFTQALSLLISAKIPLLNGIRLTKKMIEFYPLQTALEKIEGDILTGKTLHESMVKQPFFDKKMSSLIKVAEETNQTETIFNRLTYQYNQEIDSKSKLISTTLEPLIILVLGTVVAVILIAMYLPMFKLSTVIG
ncbi:MAG: type II secretion system F family protein [Tenacibaculum sp.]